MSTKTVFQTDRAGLLYGVTTADESPLEPNVFLIPAGAVEVPPPESWPDDRWPRWTGGRWDLVVKPAANDAVAKLSAFLAANPDVQEMIS